MQKKSRIAFSTLACTLAFSVSIPYANAYEEKATVAKVADGDSLYVKGSATPIRIIGIDAPEAEACGYGAAKSGLRELAGAKTLVKLSAKNENSVSVGNGMRRPLRYVYSFEAKRDVSYNLLQQGLAIFNNTDGEPEKEVRYNIVAQKASALRVGLFNPAYCGIGPPANLQMFVHYNADLNDAQNIHGKWVRLVNRDVLPVNLAGWRLRPSNRKYYSLPNITLQPQQSLVVHNGARSPYMENNDYHYSWGRKINIPDPRTSVFKTGAIYLQDPNENFRFWSYWPCVIECSSAPQQGKLGVLANHKDEYVEVYNSSSEIVDASFLVVETGASVFEIPQGNVLEPGQRIRIWTQPHSGEYSLNRNAPMLPGPGGNVLLRGNDGITVATYRW